MDKDIPLFLEKALQNAIKSHASDLHMTANQSIQLRIAGALSPLDMPFPTKEDMQKVAEYLLTETQGKRLIAEKAIDFAITWNARRWRVNIYYQQGVLALSVRLFPAKVPTLDELGVPSALRDVAGKDSGLVLVCGATGTGKSTTLAALLDEINSKRAVHIITLEDPIEYVFTPQKAFISQRELGEDFLSFPQALKSSLREAPDVILVGEIRDAETMRTAINAASTGVLVLGTLHAPCAPEAILRVEGLFPLGQQDIIRSQLSEVLLGVFSQRLIPSLTDSRVSITEALTATPAVRSVIRQGKYSQLNSIMLAGRDYGMQTMQMALEKRYHSRQISHSVFENLQRVLA